MQQVWEILLSDDLQCVLVNYPPTFRTHIKRLSPLLRQWLNFVAIRITWEKTVLIRLIPTWTNPNILIRHSNLFNFYHGTSSNLKHRRVKWLCCAIPCRIAPETSFAENCIGMLLLIGAFVREETHGLGASLLSNTTVLINNHQFPVITAKDSRWCRAVEHFRLDHEQLVQFIDSKSCMFECPSKVVIEDCFELSCILHSPQLLKRWKRCDFLDFLLCEGNTLISHCLI